MQFSDGEENLLGTLSTLEGKTYFKYHSDFIQKKINPSPFKMKFDESIQACPSMPFDGLIGLFADSLPDGWGKLIMDRFLISKGDKPDLFTPFQQLSLIGKTGTGALIYQPDTPFLVNNDFNIDLTAYAEQSLQILSGKNEEITDDFYRLTGTSGGARPKIQVLYNPITKVLKSINDNRNKDDEFWIIKFPSIHDLPDIANIEYAYYLMAIDAGIEMAPSKLFKGKKNQHFFGTKRFDRTDEGNLHLHSAAGLLHDNYRKSTLDYGHLMDAIVRLENNKSSASKVLRLGIFNVLTANQDDHSKNFSFLMNKEGVWKFSPAYDLTFSPNVYNFQSTTVAGKNQSITQEHFAELANHFGIDHLSQIWEEITQVVSEWRHYAKIAQVSEVSTQRIWNVIKK